MILNPEGKRICTYSWNIGLETNNVAEAMALWQGINQALHYGLQSLTVIGDSRLIIQSMHSKELPASIRLRQILRRIGLITSQIRAIEYFHILRKNNENADKAANDSMGLVKGALMINGELRWTSIP